MLNLRREPIDPNYKLETTYQYSKAINDGLSDKEIWAEAVIENTPINNAVVTNSHINDSEINNCSIINYVITNNGGYGVDFNESSPIATWNANLDPINTTPEPIKLLNAIDAALSCMTVEKAYQYLQNLVNQTIITEFSHSNPEQEYVSGPYTTFIYWVDGYERQVIKSGKL